MCHKEQQQAQRAHEPGKAKQRPGEPAPSQEELVCPASVTQGLLKGETEERGGKLGYPQPSTPLF